MSELDAESEAFSDSVKAAIERLARYDPSVSVDAVIDAINDGSALLMPHVDGFSVLTQNDTALHIWISCAFIGRTEKLINSLTDIVELARLLELEKVTFKTTRKGWVRLAKRIGFEQVENGSYVRWL